MFAVRLGSYSIAATLAGISSLVLFKVQHTVHSLLAAAFMARCNATLIISTTGTIQGTTRLFFRRCFGNFSKVETVIPRRPGEVGLYFLIPIFSSSLIIGLQKLGSYRRLSR